MDKRDLTQAWYVREPQALVALRATLATTYPTLHATEEAGKIKVRGSFAIKHDGADIDWYQLELTLPDDYPAAPAAVMEIGGRIPRVLDRHVFSNGTLCLGVAEDMWIKWGGRFDIGSFLEGPVRTFLIGNSLVEQGEGWPFGERAHGAAGMFEFYKEAVGFDGARKIGTLLSYLAKERIKGHWPCPCGSGKNLRDCHRAPIYELHAKVPRQVFARSLAILRSEQSDKAAGKGG
jgi:hypothetical protein